MAQDGRCDPNKDPKKEDAQTVKDGVSGNSAAGQGAQKKDAFQKKAGPDVIHEAAALPLESGR